MCETERGDASDGTGGILEECGEEGCKRITQLSPNLPLLPLLSVVNSTLEICVISNGTILSFPICANLIGTKSLLPHVDPYALSWPSVAVYGLREFFGGICIVVGLS